MCGELGFEPTWAGSRVPAYSAASVHWQLTSRLEINPALPALEKLVALTRFAMEPPPSLPAPSLSLCGGPGTRTLQLSHVSAPWLLCAWCGVRYSDYIISSHPPRSSGHHPLPIYRWEIAFSGSPSMASLPQESCFLGENVPAKGTAWEEALRHDGPLGNLQVSMRLAHGERRLREG